GVIKLDRQIVKAGILLGQEDGAGGPQNSANTITGGPNIRLTQSEDLGCIQKPTSIFDGGCGGKGKQKQGVYSDGPMSVYYKLNRGPISKEVDKQINPTKEISKSSLKQVNPLPAKFRKRQLLIHNLNLQKSTEVVEPPVSLSAFRSSTSGREVLPRRSSSVEDGVRRNPPSHHRPGKNTSSSLSSVGAVLCCSSLNSSDFRNCNKRFIDQFEQDTARKVWQGAVELGDEGEEEEERYVERILINENSEEAARILREQQKQSHP
ncbi:hypothetical protein A2U01_0020543, partial [Trifolium medium]|nr:hypothetical protein [Trifolium medium]